MLLAPVVTDMKEAANGLRWCVAEMERRYKLMSAVGVRNLAGFNKKIEEAAERGETIPDPLWKPGVDSARTGAGGGIGVGDPDHGVKVFHRADSRQRLFPLLRACP